MKTTNLLLGMVIALASSVVAGDIIVDYESRSSTDKTNVFYLTEGFEVYVLKASNFLEIEAGPRFKFGPLTLTPRLGGAWKTADNFIVTRFAIKAFVKYRRLTVVTIHEYDLKDFSLNKPKVKWAYFEGFAMLNLDGLISSSSVGINYEHYRKEGQSVWVVGPRYDYSVNKGYLKSISLWTGVTDNPTVAISFNFKM